MPDRDVETAAQRLASIVESSDDAIVGKDLNGVITSWNEAAERMFGYSREEAIGRSIRLIIPLDRQAEEDDVLRRVRGNESVSHFETVRRHKDGTLVPISLSVSPIRNAEGQVVGASKIARDISDRKRAESALAEAVAMHADLERRLTMLVAASGSLLVSPGLDDVVPAVINLAREILEADGHAVWRLDARQRVWRIASCHGVSQAFIGHHMAFSSTERIDGVPFSDPLIAEDVNTMPLLEARREAYREEGIVSMMAVPLRVRGELAGTLAFYYQRRHQFLGVEVETARALANLASAAIATAELYDSQRRSHAHSDFLAEAGRLLATSLDVHETLKRVAELAVPQIADWCAVDLRGSSGDAERLVVAHVDPAKVEMARRFRERYPEESSSARGAQHVMRTGAPEMIEQVTDEMLVAQARDPEHLRAMRELGLASYMCVPLTAHGRTLGAITFVTAESGRRYNEADLQFAQAVALRAALAVDNARAYEEVRRANQVKDDFLATLSHELRTPLNAILGYSRMLRTGLLSPAKQARAVDILDKNATSLTQIVEDILDVSRIVSGKLRLDIQPVELPDVIANSIETVRPAAEARGVRLQSVLDPGVAPVGGDPDRLQQVMWNLLSNAVKFTPRGGRVQVRLEQAGSNVEVVVSDTGVGIAPDFLPYIFERFRQADSRFSREYGGLGLGLAIARHLVEMHGGAIAAASDGPGAGASFRVTLPCMSVDADPPRDPRRSQSVRRPLPESTPIRLEGIHILAVDDETDALVLIREILESAGARVTTAESAAAALSILDSVRPDVLLSDVGMPVMDGFQLISRVRSSPARTVSEIPAAALTAYARAEDRTRALQSGFQMHLAKPVDPGELVAAVRALVPRGPATL